MAHIILQYESTCSDCQAALPVGARARYYGHGKVYGRDCHGNGPRTAPEAIVDYPRAEERAWELRGEIMATREVAKASTVADIAHLMRPNLRRKDGSMTWARVTGPQAKRLFGGIPPKERRLGAGSHPCPGTRGSTPTDRDGAARRAGRYRHPDPRVPRVPRPPFAQKGNGSLHHRPQPRD